jgi:hypothetical protein
VTQYNTDKVDDACVRQRQRLSDDEQGRTGKKSTRVCTYVLVESLVYCTVPFILVLQSLQYLGNDRTTIHILFDFSGIKSVLKNLNAQLRYVTDE